jgi:hypothetical protein
MGGRVVVDQGKRSTGSSAGIAVGRRCYRRCMALDMVTREQYPDLPEHELTSEQGAGARVLGRLVEQGQPCATCGTTDTASRYQGPQYGLALDTPESPVEQEITWCTIHGFAGMRLLNVDGTEHVGV